MRVPALPGSGDRGELGAAARGPRAGPDRDRRPRSGVDVGRLVAPGRALQRGGRRDADQAPRHGALPDARADRAALPEACRHLAARPRVRSPGAAVAQRPALTGLDVDFSFAHVFTIRDEKCVRIDVFPDKATALAAVAAATQ